MICASRSGAPITRNRSCGALACRAGARWPTEHDEASVPKRRVRPRAPFEAVRSLRERASRQILRRPQRYTGRLKSADCFRCRRCRSAPVRCLCIVLRRCRSPGSCTLHRHRRRRRCRQSGSADTPGPRCSCPGPSTRWRCPRTPSWPSRGVCRHRRRSMPLGAGSGCGELDVIN